MKFKSIILVSSLILSSVFTATIGFALDSPANNTNSKVIVTNNGLSDAKKLDKTQVLRIAKIEFSSYLKSDSEATANGCYVKNEFLELYDNANNLFAYMLPICTKSNVECGYITVGCIADGIACYEVCMDNQRLKNIRGLLNTTKTNKVVFAPPMSYFVKNSKTGTTLDVNETVNRDVTEYFNKNNNEMNSLYSSIVRSSVNGAKIDSILTRTTTTALTSSTMLATAVANEDYRLKNEATFVRIYEDKQPTVTYYGGNQGWYVNSTWQARGCGPTAASNILAYFALKNSSTYGKLYKPSNYSRTSYLSHMTDVYNVLNPGTFGLTSSTEFCTKIESFAKARSVSLTRVSSPTTFTLENTSTYIKNGITADSPVAVLNLRPPYTGYDYAWHWMTITKYFKDVTLNKRWVAVSTWGERRSIDYVTLYNAMSTYGGGLWYFK